MQSKNNKDRKKKLEISPSKVNNSNTKSARLIEKLLIGGVGGLTPLAASLLIVDVQVIDKYIRNFFAGNTGDEFYIYGYLFKVCLLFLVGSFWAYIHRSEHSLLKIYQLGIVAPGIILGLVNSAELKKNRNPEPKIERSIIIDNQKLGIKYFSPTDSKYSSKDLFSIIIPVAIAKPRPALCPTECTFKNGKCSCPSTWFEKLKDGFFSRPPPLKISCNSIPVSAYIDSEISTKSISVSENTDINHCKLVIDGAMHGVEAKCNNFDATISGPPGLVITTTDLKEACIFNVKANAQN